MTKQNKFKVKLAHKYDMKSLTSTFAKVNAVLVKISDSNIEKEAQRNVVQKAQGSVAWKV